MDAVVCSLPARLRSCALGFSLLTMGITAIASTTARDSFWNTLIMDRAGHRLLQDEPVERGEFYTRMIRIEHSDQGQGAILATFEHFPHLFEIYRSDDDAQSWRKISTVQGDDPKSGWVFEGEPDLFELPVKVADMQAGTLLIAGSSIHRPSTGRKLQQRLEVFASADHGLTWNYRGVIDQTTGIEGSLWEPNLQVTPDAKLVGYYSDERLQPKYSQVLAERVSDDGGKTWGAQKNIVAVPDGHQRPGMAVVKRIGDQGYVMSYEWVNKTENPAYVRFSKDAVNWGPPDQRGIPVQSATGSSIGGTPYVIWTPFGGPKGTLVVSARGLNKSPNIDREIFLNTNGGKGPWTPVLSPVQWQGNQEFDGWSMGMLPTKSGEGIILMSSSYARDSANEILVGWAPLPIPGKTYEIINKGTGQALTLPDDPGQSGSMIQRPLTGAANQLWTLKDLGDTKFGITNPATGLALDDFRFNARNGAMIAPHAANFLPVQQWRFLPTSYGSYCLLNVHANRVLGVVDASKADGARLQLWDDDGAADHEWMLMPQ